MSAYRAVYRSVGVVCAALFTATLSLQAQTTTQKFEPQVGQAGKDVVWVPTPQPLVDKMLDLAKVTPQDFVVDLGSGDGRTVITAAKRGARAMGIEYNPEMVNLSKRNAETAGVGGKASFLNADLFESDFSQATVVTMFLLPSINLKLRPKILDMKPGTRIVANTFDMEAWTPDETVTIPDCTSWCNALMWIVPAKVGGTWKMPQGQLMLTQNFQMVSGSLTSGGTTTQITNGRLRGDELTFTAGTTQYVGHVSGNTIEGKMAGGGTWRATR
jgi:hypothetical protein